MNKQRKVVITTTYNEMGIIIDTKVEEVAQQNLQPTCNQLATDTISRAAAIDALDKCPCGGKDENGRPWIYKENAVEAIEMVEPSPPAEPKRETATVSVGKSKGGVTMWYECAACGEPVDQGDTFCSGCGRRLIHE